MTIEEIILCLLAALPIIVGVLVCIIDGRQKRENTARWLAERKERKKKGLAHEKHVRKLRRRGILCTSKVIGPIRVCSAMRRVSEEEQPE